MSQNKIGMRASIKALTEHVMQQQKQIRDLSQVLSQQIAVSQILMTRFNITPEEVNAEIKNTIAANFNRPKETPEADTVQPEDKPVDEDNSGGGES